MRLVGDGHMCLSHYCFVLTAGSVHHGLHYIYLICWVHTFKNTAELVLLIIKHPDQGHDGGTSGITIFLSPQKSKQNCGTVMFWM